jgi:hypothetical protein
MYARNSAAMYDPKAFSLDALITLAMGWFWEPAKQVRKFRVGGM